MHESPLVSVVIPVYNAEAFVATTIQSILSQSYANIEIIAVDDGSTDASARVLELFAEKVKIFRQANQGQAKALNFGWSRAQGKYLAYLSADDVLDQNCIAEMVKVLEESTAQVGAYPAFDLMDEHGFRFSLARGEAFNRDTCLRELKCPVGPGLVFRHEAFTTFGGWDSGFRQMPDLEYLLRISSAGELTYLPRPLAAFRVHRGSQTFAKASVPKADEPLRLVEKLELLNLLKANEVAGTRAFAFLHSARLHARANRFLIFALRLTQAIRADFRILFRLSSTRLIFNALFGRMKDQLTVWLKKRR